MLTFLIVIGLEIPYLLVKRDLPGFYVFKIQVTKEIRGHVDKAAGGSHNKINIIIIMDNLLK